MKKWNSVLCVTALVCSLFLQGCVSGAKVEVNLIPILENSPSSFLCIKDNSLGVFSVETKEFTELEEFSKYDEVKMRKRFSRNGELYFDMHVQKDRFLSDIDKTIFWKYNPTTRLLQEVCSVRNKEYSITDVNQDGTYIEVENDYKEPLLWIQTETNERVVFEDTDDSLKNAYFTAKENFVVLVFKVAFDREISCRFLKCDVYRYVLFDLTGETEPIEIGLGSKGMLLEDGVTFVYNNPNQIIFYDVMSSEKKLFPLSTFRDIEWYRLNNTSIYVEVLEPFNDIQKIYCISAEHGMKMLLFPKEIVEIKNVIAFQGNLFVEAETDTMYLFIKVSLNTLFNQGEKYIQIVDEIPLNTFQPSRDYISANDILRMTKVCTDGQLWYIEYTDEAEMPFTIFLKEEYFNLDSYDPVRIEGLSRNHILVNVTTNSDPIKDEETIKYRYSKPFASYIFNSSTQEFVEIGPSPPILNENYHYYTDGILSNNGKFLVIDDNLNGVQVLINLENPNKPYLLDTIPFYYDFSIVEIKLTLWEKVKKFFSPLSDKEAIFSGTWYGGEDDVKYRSVPITLGEDPDIETPEIEFIAWLD